MARRQPAGCAWQLLPACATPASMNIFLTGGAGYIGGTTCAALLQAGHEVTVYDNLSRGHRGLQSLPARNSFTVTWKTGRYSQMHWAAPALMPCSTLQR
ncbi:UDP-glucose 4-epimerase [Chloroflexota bacterium]|nr:UDP-glucose 4-epimerase [Chloroflexota bacterium]